MPFGHPFSTSARPIRKLDFCNEFQGGRGGERTIFLRQNFPSSLPFLLLLSLFLFLRVGRSSIHGLRVLLLHVVDGGQEQTILLWLFLSSAYLYTYYRRNFGENFDSFRRESNDFLSKGIFGKGREIWISLSGKRVDRCISTIVEYRIFTHTGTVKRNDSEVISGGIVLSIRPI